MKLPTRLILVAMLSSTVCSYSQSPSSWTWINGVGKRIMPQFVANGVKDTFNNPGRKTGAVSWTDDNGDLWLFAGHVHDVEIDISVTNDLWKWDGYYWTRFGGDNLPGGLGNADPNMGPLWPAARENATVVYHEGMLYLYGGYGLGHDGKLGYLADFWTWDGATWKLIDGVQDLDLHSKIVSIGSAHKGNRPGGIRQAVSWTDEKGQFFIFGGSMSSIKGRGYLSNEFWKWDGNDWTFINGDIHTDPKFGEYGSKGIASPDNYPGCRLRSLVLKDDNGNIFMFGGSGCAESTCGELNDLWKWDGNNWTWLDGDKSANQTGEYIALKQAGNGNKPGSRYNCQGWVDSIGQLWFYGGYGRVSEGSNGIFSDMWVWNGNWIWYGGDGAYNMRPRHGEKHVADLAENRPGGRVGSAFWKGHDHSFYIWSGGVWGQDASDLWRFGPELKKSMIIKGNDQLIADCDSIPSLTDFTDFDSIHVDSGALIKSFSLVNTGTAPIPIRSIDFEDNHGFFGKSNPGFPVVLKAGDTIILVLEFDPNRVGEFYSDIRLFEANKDTLYKYRVKGKGYELQELMISDPVIAFPNAFSPNNDGLNDEWYMLHPDMEGTLSIYNRWGSLVYKGEPRWNGEFRNETVPCDVYLYIYVPSDGLGVLSGRIHVVR